MLPQRETRASDATRHKRSVAAIVLFLGVTAGGVFLHQAFKSARPNGTHTVSRPRAASGPQAADRGIDRSVSPLAARTGGVELAAIPGLVHDSLDRVLDDFVHRVNPKQDSWPVEVFSQATTQQLKDLAHVMATGDDRLDRIVATDFTCTDLRPGDLQAVYQDGRVSVWRPGETTTELVHTGPAGFGEAIRQLLQPFSRTEPITTKLKLYRVDLQPTTATTRVALHVYGQAARGIVEQHADWVCEWIRAADDVPRLLSVRVVRYEEIVTSSGGEMLFQDCTAAVFARSEVFREQLIYGIDHWRRQLESSLDPDLSGHQGIAIADFNGDGLDDLYVCQQGGLPNRMFFQELDGRVREVSGVDPLELTASALGIDLDEDGDQDLAVATVNRLLLFENDGTGNFQQRTVLPSRATLQSITASDFDLDGDLDIYACGYSPGTSIWETEQGLGAPVPYYDANNGGPNQLFRNERNFEFIDVTARVGLDVNNRRFSFAASWEDYDNDGDADLYVANDFGRNNLYRNDGGRFHDVAAQAGVEDMATGMSVSWGDYDNDGWMDLYVGNMFSSAGNRIAYQRQFLPGAADTVQQMARRLARGNSLFKNGPAGKFVDVSESATVTRGRWAWASQFADVNNDGFEDLVVANGFITHNDPDDL